MLSAIAVYYSPAIMQMAPAAMELANTLYACHQAVCSAGLRAMTAQEANRLRGQLLGTTTLRDDNAERQHG